MAAYVTLRYMGHGNLRPAAYPLAFCVHGHMAFLTPNHEIEDLGGRSRRLIAHLSPVAYYDQGSLVAINPMWVDSGDGTRPHLVGAAPLMITVADDGMRRLHITRELDRYVEIGAPYIKPANTWTKVNLGTPTRSANLLTWITANANVYVAHKGNGVKLAILLKGGWIPPNNQVAFPVGMVGLTRTGNTLFRDGVPVAIVRKPHVEDFDNPDDIRDITHEFVRLQGQDYILFTLPSLTGMSRPLIDPTLDVQPDATAGLDTYTAANQADSNKGGEATFQVRVSGVNHRIGLLKFDLSSIPTDATVDSASLYLYNGAVVANTSTMNVYRILAANSAWSEFGATWNYAVASTTRWAGDTGADGGSDAGCSVAGTDRSSTSMGSTSWASSEAVDTEHIITLLASEVEAMIDANHGIAVTASGNSNFQIKSSDATDSTKRPRLVINYTLAGGGTTYNMAATLTAVTDTPGTVLAVQRAMSVALTGVTDTPMPVFAVDRAMSATLTGATDTSNVSLAILRAMAATLTGSTDTSAPTLAVLRVLTVTLTGVTNTPDTAVLSVLRAMQAVLTGVTDTAAIELSLQGIIELAATLTAMTNTNTPVLAVQRDMAATLTGVTDTRVVALSILYQLAATLTAVTDTSPIDLSILRSMSVTLTGTTDTSAPVLAVLRAMQAVLTGVTNTSAPGMGFLFTLAAILTAATATSGIDVDIDLVTPTGMVIATFSVKKSGVTFTVKAPGVSFE